MRFDELIVPTYFQVTSLLCFYQLLKNKTLSAKLTPSNKLIDMGNSSEKPILSDENKEYLHEHTDVTMDDIESYENFLLQHPDGKITSQDFR